MPTRGKIPPFLLVLIVAFVLVGFVGFQSMKEKRNADAALIAKDLELEKIENKLKEQIKLTHKTEEERDHAKTQLSELQRISDSTLASLHVKEEELFNVKKEHEKTTEELQQVKKVVEQKEGEIVYVRSQLNTYSFEKAKASAEEINNKEATVEERQQEESKQPDEAGLDDRKRLEEEEEEDGQAKETDVSATEREMNERSKPKDDIKDTNEDGKVGVIDEKTDESSKIEGLQDEETEEQDNPDARDPDEKDAGQEDDLTEDPKSNGGLQSGEHEVAHGVE